MARERFPQLSEPAYFGVREALQRKIPDKVTPAWVIANVPGYSKEISAKTVVGQLRLLGLLDKDGKPTETARRWRVDETYAEACDAMMRHAFPEDIVGAVHGSDASSEVVQNLLMPRGLGLKTAQNVARLLLLLLKRRLDVRRPARTPNTTSRRATATRQRTAASKTEGTDGVTAHATPSASPPLSSGVTVLRYFLDNGRLAELRIPRDITGRELRRLFKHLEIDLLDVESKGDES
jgi:hypothetical protein